MTTKDNYLFYTFTAVMVLTVLLIGGFMSIMLLNIYFESNGYVICKERDLIEAHQIKYGFQTPDERLRTTAINESYKLVIR